MKFFLSLFLTGISSWMLVACEDKPEPLAIQNPIKYSDQYYENLRAYKKSKHPVAFAWFADFSPTANNASLGVRFSGIPDSMDIISLWGGIPVPKDSMVYNEMRFIQKIKGTKLLVAVIVDIGNYPQNRQGILQYAEFLKKLVYDNDLDGLDLDYEPAGSGFFGDENNFAMLVTTLSQFLGPKSGTGKLLDIDYHLDRIPDGLGPYVDYLVKQAYFTGSSSQLQSEYNDIAYLIPPEKFIVTENMGDYWATGGVSFSDDQGNITNSLAGMAAWNPSQGQKGGFGAFYFQRDYYNNPGYKYMRRAIQLQKAATVR